MRPRSLLPLLLLGCLFLILALPAVATDQGEWLHSHDCMKASHAVDLSFLHLGAEEVLQTGQGRLPLFRNQPYENETGSGSYGAAGDHRRGRGGSPSRRNWEHPEIIPGEDQRPGMRRMGRNIPELNLPCDAILLFCSCHAAASCDVQATPGRSQRQGRSQRGPGRN